MARDLLEIPDPLARINRRLNNIGGGTTEKKAKKLGQRISDVGQADGGTNNRHPGREAARGP